jgi:hypothetical protein
MIAVTAACLFAQEKVTADLSAATDSGASSIVPSVAPIPFPSKHKVRMFAAAQYDSVLSLLPRNDSLRFGGDIIGIGIDTITKDIVVIAFDRNGTPAKFVFPDSLLEKKRNTVTVPLQTAPSKEKPKLDQRGRSWFIIETALKSSVVYPMAYHWAFPHADGSVVAGLSLLTVGGSVYGTFAFTRNLDLGYGRVGLMNYGSTLLGLHFPQLLASCLKNSTSINKGVADTGNTDQPYPSDQVKAWVSMVGFPLGIYLGSRWNIVNREDAGKITLMEYFSQPTGYLLGYGLPFYFINPGNDRRAYFGISSFLTMSLLPAGFYAGYKITGDRPISAGRGALPYVSGIMGGLTGLWIPTLFYRDAGTIFNNISHVRLIVTTTLIGYGGGTALGLMYHTAIVYTYWQTFFIGASSCAGALMGIAFPLIAKVQDNHKPYVIASIMGSWTGFFLGERLSLSLFEKSDRDRNASRLSLSIPGLAALPVILTKDRHTASRNLYNDTPPTLPVADVEWKF